MLPATIVPIRENGSVMTTPQDVQQFIGRTAVGSDGSKIGNIGQVYLDEQTGQPL
jgi:sporulation protein YlmC with PRC-barrel domain